jgi:hypothetical protein
MPWYQVKTSLRCNVHTCHVTLSLERYLILERSLIRASLTTKSSIGSGVKEVEVLLKLFVVTSEFALLGVTSGVFSELAPISLSAVVQREASCDVA